MKSLNPKQLKTTTLAGFICLLTPLSIYGVWIYAADLGTSQPESVAIFRSYFPNFLDNRWGTTLLSIFFCVAAIVFSSISFKQSDKIWKVLNIIIFILSSLLLNLNVFSMM